MSVFETHLAGRTVHRGKVRDIYDLGDRLLLVSTDRISAFDWVLPTPIPDKGRVLTELSRFWFERVGVPHHLITTDVDAMELPVLVDRKELAGRTMLVRKAEVVPVECVVRGYLAGSGWREYEETGRVCGIELPSGLVECDRLAEPIFTPATKAKRGTHDENIAFERVGEIVGFDLANRLRDRSIELYQLGTAHALKQGLIIADTKFEFGLIDGQLILVDEVMTPDSSRFWPADQYQPGCSQPSFDKQFVRDWLSRSGWDKNSPPPELPAQVVAVTRAKYLEAYQRLTGDLLAS
jgi:phosphoribosylaminoimidazole-succinocarboxamide synthase